MGRYYRGRHALAIEIPGTKPNARRRSATRLVHNVGMTQKITPIAIPDDIAFTDLRLERDSTTGDVSFDTGIIARIEVASGLPPEFFMSHPEDVLAALITTWYAQHLAVGGARDAVADDLISEANAEDSAGQNFSHQPGRA